MQVIGAGSTILFRPPGQPKFHLWLVLTDPDSSTGEVVAVMVRTATRYTDDTVVLQKGDHPFIRHESSVHYSSATYFKVNSIAKAIANGHCHLKENLSNTTLTRVREGLLDSPYTVQAIKDYCRCRF